MNKHNRAFKQRIDKAALAMQHLIKHECAIVSLAIEDASTVIQILPPPTNKVKGTLLSIVGTKSGREHMMVTRLYGCTVRWNIRANEILETNA